MRRIWLLLCVVVLVAAACGDDGGGGNPFGVGDDGSASSDTGGGDDGGGDDNPFTGGGDTAAFCAQNDEIGSSMNLLTDDPGEIREAIPRIRDLIDDARGNAPAEIRDAVNTLADNTLRLFDAVEGANFDITQISDDQLLELTAGSSEASAAIDAYCAGQDGGDDDFGSDDSTMVDDGGAEDSFEFEDDGVSVGGGGNIPDDFPDELVPPTYDEVTTVNIAGTRSVSFTVTDVDYATVRDHYLGVLGDPSFELNSGDGSTATWSIGDPTTGVNVSIIDGGDGSVLITAADLGGG